MIEKNNLHSLNISETPEKFLDEDLKKYFTICSEKVGFVPNVLRAYSWNQKKLRYFSRLYNEVMLGDSNLSILDREMIALVVSSSNNCFYCQVAHGAAVRIYSKDQTLSEVISMNFRNANLNKREMTMLNFSWKLSTSPDQITNKDRNYLRDEGFSDDQIWDICEVVGFFNMTNRLASGVDMKPNDEYHKQGR